jgi:GNAT superfamily N-acetyltransferase
MTVPVSNTLQPNVHIERVHQLPLDLLAILQDESWRTGFRFVQRLIDDWQTGSNRFDRPGERLLAAFVDGRVVGIGGLNIDPYTTDHRSGRLRHLYVLEAHRRQGIGRCLVERLIAEARPHFDRLRLRTNSSGAALFYETVGFQHGVAADTFTHCLDLSTGLHSTTPTTPIS